MLFFKHKNIKNYIIKLYSENDLIVQPIGKKAINHVVHTLFNDFI